MRSSTSSFRSELKVLAVVVGVLVATEVGTRTVGPFFSQEMRQIIALPVQADRLVQTEGVSVLVMGNSLTKFGFDAAVFEEEMRSNQTKPISTQVPWFLGSDICEWYHIFKHFFVDQGRIPDVLILPFNFLCMRDGYPVRIKRLVYFCPPQEIPEVLRRDLQGFGRRVEFIQSYLFASFANRGRVRLMVFDQLIPYFRPSEEAIHKAAQRTKDKSEKKTDFAYKQLERLLKLARRHHVRVFCVAMPPKEEAYPMDPHLVQVIEEGNASLFDLREIPGLSKSHFQEDTFHLNRKGAALLTRTLALRLLQECPRLFRGKNE